MDQQALITMKGMADPEATMIAESAGQVHRS